MARKIVWLLEKVAEGVVSLYTHKVERTITLWLGLILLALCFVNMTKDMLTLMFSFQPLPGCTEVFITYYLKEMIYFLGLNIVFGQISLKIRG